MTNNLNLLYIEDNIEDIKLFADTIKDTIRNMNLQGT